MPEPLGRSQRYMPGLDGLRAVAVLAVVAYHFGFSWAQGGLLGVGVFFTLSGYLITDLLLAQFARGSPRLGRFWLGRARRLLPALFLMLAVVTTWVAVLGPAQPAEFGHGVVAAVFYVANWQLIFQHVSYFARFGPPSPLGHLWSLGVEEQFYVVWPLLLLLGVRVIRERSSSGGLRPRLAAVTLVLAVGSAIEMAVLYRPSFDPSRVYFGTDTRAFEILAGAALAMVWPSTGLRTDVAGGARHVLDAVGAAGLAGIIVLVWRTDQYGAFIYRGGFVILTLASVCVIAVLVHPACRLGSVLGVAPLRWIGVRSYGIYLWSLPIVALTTPAADSAINPWRDALQFVATLGVAALSWRFVEDPIRRGALGRLWGRLRSAGWSPQALPRGDRIAVGAAAGLLIGAVMALALVNPTPDATAGGQYAASLRTAAIARTYTSRLSAASSRTTSCRAVIHIGDSTSEGLISSDYLPNPRRRMNAQYARVGVGVSHFDIAGARSIVERYEGQANAAEVAGKWVASGYRGCWVLALGTNDTANVYVGSSVSRLERIQRMMALIGDQPVMWVNVKTLLSSGPYSEQNMRLWNEALLQACREFPNMRIFDWASAVRSEWFIDDGIHYNTPGYAARSRLIADALAHAFPASGARSGCVVS